MCVRCDICGKFRKESEVALLAAEGDEQWIECKFCISPSDYDEYFKSKEEVGS